MNSLYNLIENLLENEETGIRVSQQQADKLAGIFSSFGIDPDVMLTQTDSSLSEEEVNDVDNVDVPKPSGDWRLNITPEAIDAAKKFYEIGKDGARWYNDAHDILAKGFTQEQDMVLFALLLAATSVQNEVYVNFIEAAVVYNAIAKDIQENKELLSQYVNDPEIKFGAGVNILDDPEYSRLYILSDAKTVKMLNTTTKFGNLRRILKLYLEGSLTKDNVRVMISDSVRPTLTASGKLASFDSKNPLIRALKIANYALTLIDPDFSHAKDNPFNVVIDTWMFRIFFPEKTARSSAEGKKNVNKLFGSEAAYSKVTEVVSRLASEAGISPHQMQAALWLGVRREWEGKTTSGEADYIASIDSMIQQYAELWGDVKRETHSLENIISKLSVPMAAQAIRAKRVAKGKALGAEIQRRRKLAKSSGVV